MKTYVIATETIKDEAMTFTDPGGAPLFRVMPDDNGLTSGETDRSVIVGGSLCAGPASGADRGVERAGGGAALRDRSENSLKDVEVLSVAGLPAQQASGAAEARSIHRGHRPHSGR